MSHKQRVQYLVGMVLAVLGAWLVTQVGPRPWQTAILTGGLGLIVTIGVDLQRGTDGAPDDFDRVTVRPAYRIALFGMAAVVAVLAILGWSRLAEGALGVLLGVLVAIVVEDTLKQVRRWRTLKRRERLWSLVSYLLLVLSMDQALAMQGVWPGLTIATMGGLFLELQLRRQAREHGV